jgi:hypothetical protein
MTTLPQHKMTVDEIPGAGRPGRFELYAGTAYQMAPERARHAEITLAQRMLAQSASGACLAGPARSMTLRIDDSTADDPDRLV